MKNGIDLIKEERIEQIEKHGYNPDYDNKHHSDGELLRFAIYLIQSNNDNFPKGFTEDHVLQFFLKSRIKQLTVAGALIAAEIDRLQNK